MITAETLIEEYKSATTERQRADIEARLWETRPQTVPGEKRLLQRDYLHKLLGGTIGGFEPRATLRNAPESLRDALWHLVDVEKLPTKTATKLLHDAKELFRDKPDEKLPILLKVIKEYRENSHRVASSTGKFHYRRGSTKLPPLSVAHAKSTKSFNAAAQGGLWVVIRKAFSNEMSQRLAGLDALVAAQLWKDLEAELQILLDSFQAKVYSVKKREQNGYGITVHPVARKEILHACRTLHMEPPAQGKPVDVKVARRMKYKLARLYHPDSNGGDEANRPRYEAVIAAYTVLMDYMSSIQPVKDQPQSTTTVD